MKKRLTILLLVAVSFLLISCVDTSKVRENDSESNLESTDEDVLLDEEVLLDEDVSVESDIIEGADDDFIPDSNSGELGHRCNDDGSCEDPFVCEKGGCFRTGVFITVWKTDSESVYFLPDIILPLVEQGTCNFTVKWGDGSDDKITEWDDPALTHMYDKHGKYEVTIEGVISGWQFSESCEDSPCENARKLFKVKQWGSLGFDNTESQFSQCGNLDVVATDTPDLTRTKSLHYLFFANHSLIGNASFSEWNVSNVTNMCGVFFDAGIFNQDIGSWDVSNVTDMHVMFSRSYTFNQDIGSWDVSNVTDFVQMFGLATHFNQDIGSWDVSNAIRLDSMFARAGDFNQDIGLWNVQNVTSTARMFFLASSFNQDIGSWNVSNVSLMYEMFSLASSFNQDIGSWNVSNVKDMDGMFYGVTLSTSNYDSLLIGWSKLRLKHMVHFDGGDSQYSFLTATVARAKIISDFGWTITDGGQEE